MKAGFLLPLLWASATHAQQALIQSGEHDGFTRLSIPIGVGSDWTSERDGQRIILTAEGLDATAEDVFRLIKRDRISSVTSVPGKVEITLACACDFESFLFRERYVVIDVKPADPASISPQTQGADPILLTSDVSSEELPAIPLLPGSDRISTLPRSILRAPVGGARSLEETQRELAAAISDAAVRDTVTPPAFSIAEPLPPLNQGNSRIEGATMLPGIEFHSGFTSAVAIDVSDSRCWPESYTDVASWGDDGVSLAEAVAPLRARLTDAASHPDQVAIEELAKAYLYFGFGQEALEISRLGRSDSRALQALRDVARIIEDQPVTEDAFEGQASCEGPAGLWSYLAKPSDEPVEPRVSDNAIFAFMALPVGPKLAVGPTLTLQLLKDGRRPQALDIRDHIDSLGLAREELRLLDSELDLSTDEDLSQKIDAVVAGNPDLPVPHLVALTNRILTSTDRPSSNLINRLEEALFTARRSSDFPPLVEAYIKSLERLERYGEAFDKLYAADTPPLVEEGEIRDSILASAAELASVDTFLDLAFREQTKGASALVQNMLADRLLQLGFPEQALSLLIAPTVGSDMAERRYLRAEAFAALEDFAAVNETLSGITTVRADAIRAGADWEAIRSVEDAGEGFAWRRADWTALIDAEDDMFRSLAELATQPAPNPDPVSPLPSGRLLADEAATARGVLEVALDRFSVEPE